jgi:O-antigen ligase
MATSSKKDRNKKPSPPQKPVTRIEKTAFDSGNLIPLILLGLYLMVELVPRMDAADVMAPQWIYLGLLNFLGMGYIVFNKEIPAAMISRISRNALSLIYFALFLLAGISFFYAINKNEFLVVYSRYVITVVAFFTIAVLLAGRLQMVRYIALLLTAVLFLQSLSVVSQFFSQLGEKTVNEIIFNMKGNSGNKNILAVGMAMKIPFVVYCLSRFRGWAGLFFSVTIFLGATALFFVNARAAFLALLFQLALYTAYETYRYVKDKNGRELALKLSLILIPVILAFGVSTVVLNNAISAEQDAAYGSVTERLSTISLTEEGSNGRLQQWKSAVDYISHHPVTGCGYGNWKLASIPYERSFVNDLLVTYHVHNDLLETSAELGWPGGLLFLALFACSVIFLVKAFFSKGLAEQQPLVIMTTAALATYFNDAMFNFPSERPAMQLFLVFLLALSIALYPGMRKDKAVNNGPAKKIYAGLAILLLVPALYASFLIYNSMVAQYRFNSDMLQEKPRYSFAEVDEALPDFPELNAFCFPVNSIKARYLENEQRYPEALSLLRSSDHIVPALSLNEFLKGRIFIAMNRKDSAFYYAKKAFALRPRSIANYQLLAKTAYLHNDTATLNRAFREFTSHRKKEASAWKEYISYLNVMTGDPALVKPYLDSAEKLFPADAEFKKFRSNTSMLTKEAQVYFDRGLSAFNAKQYSSAIADFKKVTEMNPQSYTSFENIGMSYFALNQPGEALGYFDQVIRMNAATDGKSEFFKAMCLSQTGRKAEACPFLRAAAAKGYKDAAVYMKDICGSQQ